MVYISEKWQPGVLQPLHIFKFFTKEQKLMWQLEFLQGLHGVFEGYTDSKTKVWWIAFQIGAK